MEGDSRDRRRAARARRVLARRELPVRRADLPARQPAAARAAAARARQAAAARPLGHDARAELPLRAPEPGDPRARPRRDLRRRARARRPGGRRERVPRGDLHRDLPAHHARRGRAAARCSGSSRFPAASRATSRPRRPARSTRAASSATRSSHAYGAAFDNPDLVVACVVGDGEAETGPLATSWHSNKFLEPGTRRRGAADPPPQRLQDREPDRARADPGATSCARCCGATATSRSFVAGDEPDGGAPAAGRDARRRARRDRRASSEPRATTAHERPRWPMIVLRTPEGLDRPERGRRAAGRGHVALAPGAARRGARRTPRTSRSSRSGCGATGPEELFDDARRAPSPSSPRSRRTASGGWARTRTRTAASCCATSSCRTSATTPSTSTRPGRRPSEATRVLGGLPARRHRAQPATTSASSAPTRPPRTGSTPSSRSPTARGTREIAADRRAPRARRPRHGGALASTSARAGSRATCSPAGTASSTATRRSSTSSTRCSTSTRSG